MLCAIRGGGGTLGVIVELTVKVYDLDKVLGGMIVFDSRDLVSTIENFETGYREISKQGLPAALGVQHVVANTPMGKAFIISFLWSSSDVDEGRRYLDRISSLANVVHLSVKEMTILEWLKESEAFVPKSAYGCNLSVNVREMTDEVVHIIGQQLLRMPDDPATLFSTHELRGSSARPNHESVFAARTPHHLIELIATSSDAERAKTSWAWAVEFRDALTHTDPRNILPATYISLTPPEESSLELIYQEHRDKLAEIKSRYDPDNVFKHALPMF